MPHCTSVFLLITYVGAVASITISVDCDTGSDNGDGSPAAPFATVRRARDEVRARQPLTADVTVSVTGSCTPRGADGLVDFSQTLLSLDPALDSGNANAVITYAGQEGASLLGGASVPPIAWRSPSPDRPNVFTVDLSESALNVSRYGFGDLAGGGLGTCAHTAMELVWNGTVQTLARYPNIMPNGTWEWMNIAQVRGPLEGFTLNGTNGERALSWTNESNAWFHGYWSFDWADSWVAVQNITREANGAAHVAVRADTPPVYGFVATARLFAANILAELDAPGEYYIDVNASVLYFMPPGGDPTAAPSYLTVSRYIVATSNVADRHGSGDAPLLTAGDIASGAHVKETSAAGAVGVLSYVSISGLAVRYARDTGIALQGASNVSIIGVQTTAHGHSGITLTGTSNLVSRVFVSETGCTAATVYGGDEAALVSGANKVADSNFTRFARIIRTYNPGIAFGGVGNSYERNIVSNAPHTGMLGGGVSLTFTKNTFDTLCYESTDAGAWYAGRSWTRRGNKLLNNTFRNVRNKEHMTLGYAAVQAIYLDDQLSGTSIIGNSCYDSQTCYFVGGGRDTRVEGNACLGTTETCVHLDARGLDWQRDSCTDNATYVGDLVKGLFAVNYTNPPYAVVFPEIVDTLTRRPCTPVNVTVVGNSYCTGKFIDASDSDIAAWGDRAVGNVQGC